MQVIINAGSSSLKWAVYLQESHVISGVIERIGAESVFCIKERKESVQIASHVQAVGFVLRFLAENKIVSVQDITHFVHRVVHGAEKYDRPVLVTPEVLSDIEAFSVLAPLHNPANLAGIRACMAAAPHAKNIAIFDTAFHQTIPPEVYLYGIPYNLYETHRIRKYGFHGTSHQYISTELTKLYGQDAHVISCHLGSGSSITAVRAGKSVDTTMGFTPLDGVLMSTRTGEIDPEIPLFLLKHGHYSVEELSELFNKKSGFVGLTGKSDLRDIYEASQQGDEKCTLVIEMLCYKIAYYISALRVAVPKLSAIAFTGGIGEKAWYVRSRVCALLQIPLDEERNQQHAPVISPEQSTVRVHIIPAQEEYMMQLLALSLMSS